MEQNNDQLQQSSSTNSNVGSTNVSFLNGLEEYYGQLAAMQRAQMNNNGCGTLPFNTHQQLSQLALAQLQLTKNSTDTTDTVTKSFCQSGIFPSLGNGLNQNNEELTRNAPTPPAVVSISTAVLAQNSPILAENGSRTPVGSVTMESNSSDSYKSNIVLLSTTDTAKPRQVFVCSINGTLKHGQQIHLITSHGQVFSTTVAQLNIGMENPPFPPFLNDNINRANKLPRFSPPKFSMEKSPPTSMAPSTFTHHKHSSSTTPFTPTSNPNATKIIKNEENSSAGEPSSNLSKVDHSGQENSEHLTIAKATCHAFPKGRLSSSSSETNDMENISEHNNFDGINLEEIKEFAKAFKMKRLSLGLTQTQVGQALSMTEGPAYSQSAICRFEKLDITPKSAQKIKPVLEKWMSEIDEKISSGHITPGFVGGAARLPAHTIPYRPASIPAMVNVGPILSSTTAPMLSPVIESVIGLSIDTSTCSNQQPQAVACSMMGLDVGKKRKRRTSFTPQALEILNRFFERNTHPTGAEMTALAESLNYDREVVRVWFCNKRQALKNTIKKLKHTDYAQCCAE